MTSRRHISETVPRVTKHKEQALVSVKTSRTDMAEQNYADIITHILVIPLLIASLLGNTLAIIVKLHRRKSKAFNGGDLLIINLAVCDINKTWSVYVTWIYAYIITDQWKHGLRSCAALNKLVLMLFSVTSLTLLLLTIERYLLIMKPFNRWFSLRKTQLLLAVLWIVVFVSFAEPFFFQFSLIDVKGKTQCSTTPNRSLPIQALEMSYLLLVIVVPCAIIFVLSSKASRKLCKNIKSSCSQMKTSGKFNNKMRRNKNAIYMLRSITIGSLLCYVPWVVTHMIKIRQMGQYMKAVDQTPIQPLLVWFIFGGFCNTPFTYLIFSTEFRKEIKALFQKRKISKPLSGRVSPKKNEQ